MRLAALAFVLATLSGAAAAQDYPNRPIRLIVPMARAAPRT